MKTINFKQEAEFRSEEKLRHVFGIKGIYFDKSTIVIFKGKISLNEDVHFSGICKISKDVVIDKGCNLKNVVIGEGCSIRSHSVLNDCSFGRKNIIGPFCFVRNETSVGDRCIVGSHVEVTRSKISNEVKISHQAFIGDATIGNKVIIGAGFPALYGAILYPVPPFIILNCKCVLK